MSTRCVRCRGTYLPSSYGEWSCASCGYIPPESWRLKVPYVGVKRIVTQTMKDLMNDLRSDEAWRVQSAREFIEGHPYFLEMARFFKTTPARLKKWIEEEIVEKPNPDKRTL